MRLQRNVSGRGKYGIVRWLDLPKNDDLDVKEAIATLFTTGVLEWGTPGSEGEFFVLRLKDRFAQAALMAYAAAAGPFDEEYAAEVRQLAMRAGPSSPWCKEPD